MNCDNVNAGFALAKAEGRQLGRRKIAAKVERAIRVDLEAEGVGIQKLAKKHGVGVGIPQRIEAAIAAWRRTAPYELNAERTS